MLRYVLTPELCVALFLGPALACEQPPCNCQYFASMLSYGPFKEVSSVNKMRLAIAFVEFPCTVS